MNVVDEPQARHAHSPVPNNGNPFVGARPFMAPPAHHQFFCARTGAVQAVTTLLRTHRAVILHGGAGVGKTSLLHGALLPALVATGDRILLARADWCEEELVAWLERLRLAACDGSCLVVIDAAAPGGAGGLHDGAGALLPTCAALLAAAPDLRLLCSVRSPHAGALVQTLRQHGVVAQEYALAALAPASIGAPLTQLSVEENEAAAFVTALCPPAVHANGSSGAVTQIEPALLQIAGRALWPQLDGGADDVRRRVDAALTAHCAASLDAALARHPGLVGAYDLGHWIVQHLIPVNGAPTLLHRTATESAGLPTALIDTLEDSWLLRTVLRNGNCWVELLDARLAAPLQQAAGQLEAAAPLAHAAANWANNGRAPHLLLDSGQVAQAVTELAACPARYGVLEQELVAASVMALGHRPPGNPAAGKEVVHARRLAFVAALIASALLLLTIWGFALARTAQRAQRDAQAQLAAQATVLDEQAAEIDQLWPQLRAAQAEEMAAAAQRQRNEQLGRALRAGQLAGAALLRREDAPTQALLYAVEALRVQQEAGEPPVPEAVQGLRDLLATLGGRPYTVPTDDIAALALRADGQLVVAGDTTGGLHLWHTATAQRATAAAAHAGPVWAVAWLPDGRLVSAGADGVLRLWRSAERAGALELTPVAQATLSTSELYALDVAPAGGWIAVGDAGGGVYVGQAADLASWLPAPGHDAAINVVRFAPDGRALASGSLDGEVQLRTLPLAATDGAATDVGASELMTKHAAAVNALAFSPDGRWFASAGADGSLMLYDRSTATATNLAHHASAVNTLAFAADSQWLASADDDGLVRLWPVADPLAVTLLRGHRNSVRRLAFLSTEQGPRLLTISYDRTARLWDYLHLEANPVVLRGHDDQLTHLAVATDGRFATAAYDRTVRLWSTDAPFAQADPVLTTGYPQGELALAPDGTRLVASSLIHPYAEVWDTANQRPLFRLGGHSGALAALAYSPDGALIFTGGRDGLVRIWEASGAVPPASLHTLTGHVGPVNSLAVHPGGLLLASGGDDTTVRLWDVLTGAERQSAEGHSAAVMGVAFSPDGAQLASVDRTGLLLLRDAMSGAVQQRLTGDGVGFLAVDFRADGRWVAAAAEDGAIWLWDLAALALGPTTLRRHTTEVNTLAFSPAGDLLASADADGLLYLWDLTRLSAAPVVVRAHPASVNALGFAAGGAALYSAGADGAIRRWALQLDDLTQVACATAGRNLTATEWEQVFDTAPYRPTCPMHGAQ